MTTDDLTEAQALKVIERAFERGECPPDCEHLHTWREPHGETLYDCRLLEPWPRGRRPWLARPAEVCDCPLGAIALAAWREGQREEGAT